MVLGDCPPETRGAILSLTIFCAHARTSSKDTAPLPLRSRASPSRQRLTAWVAKPPSPVISQLTSLGLAAAISTKFSLLIPNRPSSVSRLRVLVLFTPSVEHISSVVRAVNFATKPRGLARERVPFATTPPEKHASIMVMSFSARWLIGPVYLARS